jgi:hypothetical protein
MTTMTYQPSQGTNVTNQIGSYSYGADGHNVNPSNVPGVPMGKAIATQGAIMVAKHYGPKLARTALTALRGALR